MIRTVVAFDSEHGRSSISGLMEKNGIPVRYCCRSGLEVIRAIKKMGGGVVVCGYKLPDMTAEQLAFDLREIASFLVVAKPASLDLCESEDIFRLPTPVKPGELIGSINMLIQLDQKNTRNTLPRRSPEDEELIRKAKELLMDRNGMTEPQAYQFLQRKSMNTSSKMTEIAKLVLNSLDSSLD